MLLSILARFGILLSAVIICHATTHDDGNRSSRFRLKVPSLPNGSTVEVDDGRILFNATGENATFQFDEQYGILDSSGQPCGAPGTYKQFNLAFFSIDI